MKKTIIFAFLFIMIAVSAFSQWSNDAAMNNAICDLTGEQAIPKVVTSISGDTYISWFSNDSGNYDVRLQRLDVAGYELWDHNGLLISDNPAMTWLTDWDMTVDADNHAILTFQDIRNGGNNNIYAYRISPDGTFIWGEDGIELSNSSAFDVAPKVCVTSAGNIVVTWQAEDVIIMQKIAPDGTLLWGANGITMSCADTYSWPQLLAVENDNILLKFFHDSGPPNAPTRHCYMQKFDIDGNPVWVDDAVVTNAGGISAWTQVFSIESDGANGCFIAWHDDRNNDMDASSFVQHVNSDGSIGFTDDGIELSTQSSRENYYPKIAFNTSTWELYVYWMETDSNQIQRGLYGQKLDAEGNRLWTDNGKPIIEISDDAVSPISARIAGDDVIVCFEESASAANALVKAAKLDVDGEFVWNTDIVTLCSVASAKVHSEASYFANGQMICTWEDDRNGTSDIYAQNVNSDGTIGLPSGNGFITGNVTLNGGVGVIEEVEITAGSVVVNPDNNGDYEISISPGTYDVTASLECYDPQTTGDVVVTEGNATTGIDLTLEWIAVYNPPQNLTVDELTGFVSWDPPEPYPGTEVAGYNLYRDGILVSTANVLEFQLEDLVYGMEYTIAITAVYTDGGESFPVEYSFVYYGTNANGTVIFSTQLNSNFPNPFNPVTTISYSIQESGNILLQVFNLKGQIVKTLVNEMRSTGTYSVIWDGTDRFDKPVSSGIYLYKMKTDNYLSSKKMILLK